MSRKGEDDTHLHLLAFNATDASWCVSIGWLVVAAATLCDSHPEVLTPSFPSVSTSSKAYDIALAHH